MKDKIALVTGSNRGIGRDIALKLADVTSGVAVHYKNNRLGKFEDISSAVLFLVSDEADFISGTNLIVAGGWKI